MASYTRTAFIRGDYWRMLITDQMDVLHDAMFNATNYVTWWTQSAHSMGGSKGEGSGATPPSERLPPLAPNEISVKCYIGHLGWNFCDCMLVLYKTRGTEFAGPENEITKTGKCRARKCRTWKMTAHVPRLVNAWPGKWRILATYMFFWKIMTLFEWKWELRFTCSRIQ